MADSMDRVQRFMPISMARENLDDIPVYELPEGYSFRWYEPGDEAHWVRIGAESDEHNTFTTQLFVEQFGSDPDEIGRRQCYLLDPDHKPVGTATAWMTECQQMPCGLVHWVAILPALQGRGLSKPLMTVVCKRLRDLGHDRAFLNTLNLRVSAINLYLKFGFVPVIHTDEELKVWHDLQKKVSVPLKL